MWYHVVWKQMAVVQPSTGREIRIMSSVIQIQTVHYPGSDGKPIGETDMHRDAMIRHIEFLISPREESA